MAADCKSAGLTPYEGSNPSPTMKELDRRWVGDAGVAQLVERKPSKLDVAGSSPVSRSAQEAGMWVQWYDRTIVRER